MTTMTPAKLPGPSRLAGLQKLSKDRLSGNGWQRFALVTAAYLASLVVLGALAAIQGANPFTVFDFMLGSALFNSGSFEQTLLHAIPITLAALAVAIAARAGLVNVGGEGQLIIGAVAATGIGVAIGADVPGPVSWIAMIAGGAAVRRSVRGRAAHRSGGAAAAQPAQRLRRDTLTVLLRTVPAIRTVRAALADSAAVTATGRDAGPAGRHARGTGRSGVRGGRIVKCEGLHRG